MFAAEMRPLFTLSARWVLVCCCLVFSVALVGASVRLLPWLVARDVPLETSLVFAEVLAARGAEVAVLIGLPVGTAIAAALFVERGEARALAALGVRPLRLAAGLVPLAVATVLSSIAVARSTETPTTNEFVGRLVGSGRRVCAGARPPRRVDVPLVSMSWLCFATGPRLVGAVPGLRSELWFTAADLRGFAGERGLIVDDLRVVGPNLGLSLHATEARVSGLPGGPGARRPGGALRGLLTGLVATATALASAWGVLRRNPQGPSRAAAAAGAAALATIALLRSLDDGQAGVAAHALAVPVGAVMALLLQAAARPFPSSHIAGRKA
jgi:hypothetical protein